jgi:hypothetical protein
MRTFAVLLQLVCAPTAALARTVERLEAIGGALDVRSSPGAGTRVIATVPAAVVFRPHETAAAPQFA